MLRDAGRVREAGENLEQARALFGEMGLDYWVEKAEKDFRL